MTRTLFLFLLFSQAAFSQVNLNQGLVAYYPFTGNANDASGNNNNPVFNNATLTADHLGNPNSAYLFNGIDNYIQIPNSPSLNPTNQISICALVMVNGFYIGPCHGNSILMKGDADFLPGNYFLRFDDGGFTNYQNCAIPVPDINHQNFYGVNTQVPSGGYNPFIQTGQWYSIIYTSDGITSNFYVNCELKISIPANGITFSNQYDLFLGRLNNPLYPYWFNGVMDEVRIYNRVLDLQEIDSLSLNGMSILASGNNSICSGDSTQLSASGATTYLWSPATGLSNPNISNPVASPISTIQYIVTGTNLNGCSAEDTVNITVNPKPLIIKSNDTAICKNTPAQLLASGGVSYSWSPPASLSNPSIPDPIATPTVNTTYYVVVTDANMCNNNDSINVSIRPDPVFTVIPSSDVCQNNSVQLTASGGDIYSWQPSNSLNDPNISNPVATPAATTTYSVQITESTCNNSSTLTTTVTILPLPTVQASKSNDIDCSNDASQLNGTGAIQYIWTPAATLNNSNISNPLASPSSTTLYTVEGTDAFGCVNSDTVTVYVTGQNEGSYLMPNAFTPNKDGLNDCFGIKYWGQILELDFSVFNRWGQRIFHTDQPGQCWDGTFKGELQPSDVYVYMIKAKTVCKSNVFRKGTFILIR